MELIKTHRDIVADVDFDKLVVDFANKRPKRMTSEGVARGRGLEKVGVVALQFSAHELKKEPPFIKSRIRP